MRFNKKTRRLVNNLAYERAICCERACLLNCMRHEQRIERQLWEAFQENTNGDYFADIPDKKIMKLPKETILGTEDISRYRCYIACLRATEELKRNFNLKTDPDTQPLLPLI